jgi:hypothetical protein
MTARSEKPGQLASGSHEYQWQLHNAALQPSAGGTSSRVPAAAEREAFRTKEKDTELSIEVAINAKPAPVAIEVGKTAVIVVDMQNDLGAPTGTAAS